MCLKTNISNPILTTVVRWLVWSFVFNWLQVLNVVKVLIKKFDFKSKNDCGILWTVCDLPKLWAFLLSHYQPRWRPHPIERTRKIYIFLVQNWLLLLIEVVCNYFWDIIVSSFSLFLLQLNWDASDWCDLNTFHQMGDKSS